MPDESSFDDFGTIFYYSKSRYAKKLLRKVTHPFRRVHTHRLLKGSTECIVIAETALLGQLLGSKGMLGSYSLVIETDEMFDAQIVDIGIISRTLTGEILAEIGTVGTNSLGKLEKGEVML